MVTRLPLLRSLNRLCARDKETLLLLDRIKELYTDTVEQQYVGNCSFMFLDRVFGCLCVHAQPRGMRQPSKGTNVWLLRAGRSESIFNLGM